jgi:large subunit ribosomal protein L6
MSRIGRLPIVVPPRVEVNIEGTHIKVKGPNGSLEYTFPGEVSFALENGVINVTRPSDARMHRALHGTTRALIQNMVTGVSTGFVRILEINGVGYRAEVQGDKLLLNLGYSHPIEIAAPDGISFETDPKTRQIKVLGADKQ